MTNGQRLDKKVVVPGLALLTLFVIGAEAPVFAQGRAAGTRSSGGDTKSAGTVSGSSRSSSSSSSTTSTSRRTTASRSASPKARSTRQSTPASRSRSYTGSGYRGYRSYHNIGLHFGYGGFYGRHGYYYPYYYSPYYWGVPYYMPRRAHAEYRLGAFDLNVRPKKAEVYLDGQYLGTAGRYDGFPEHLWLEQGSYELIFYRPGLVTERRVLTIYPGVVVDVRIRLQPGESIAPSELSNVDRSQGAMAEVRSAYQEQAARASSAAPAAPATVAELDTRAAPGRLRLKVLPADASVYLDGRFLGSGAELGQLHAGLVVEAGSHLIEVVRPGYAAERREFAVDEGADIELEVLLEAG